MLDRLHAISPKSYQHKKPREEPPERQLLKTSNVKKLSSHRIRTCCIRRLQVYIKNMNLLYKTYKQMSAQPFTPCLPFMFLVIMQQALS